VEECVRYSIVHGSVCSVQCCRWKNVFGTVLYMEVCVSVQCCRWKNVFGTVLYMEVCVWYSVVSGGVCSVRCCRWKSVFGTLLYLDVCSVQCCRWKSVFGTVLCMEVCVRYSVVDGRMCSVQYCTWKCVFEDCFYRWYVNTFYHSCTYNRLPADEPSCSKHLKDIVKTDILI
jgi:hypothetical protein